MWFLRYVSEQTDRQTDRQTKTLIAILLTAAAGDVTTLKSADPLRANEGHVMTMNIKVQCIMGLLYL